MGILAIPISANQIRFVTHLILHRNGGESCRYYRQMVEVAGLLNNYRQVSFKFTKNRFYVPESHSQRKQKPGSNYKSITTPR